MALSGGVWELNASATASNVNAGYFNPSNTNMPTDLTTDAGTGNTSSPVVSSASYNFVAGDVGNWLYIKSGTNWTPGWYQIASVASNKATLTASIGTAVQQTILGYPYPEYMTNTVVGCATVGTPTNGTWSIDYSQSTAANNSTINDLASANGTTNPAVVTSATYTFGVNTVGNGIHVNSGTNWTAGWYEIVSVSGGAATLDRAVGTLAALAVGTYRIGGALSLGSSDDAVFENGVAGARFFVKNGSYNQAGAVTISAAGTAAKPISIEGYNLYRGDTPSAANQPTINCGANSFTVGSNWITYNIKMTGTAAVVLALTTAASSLFNSTITNTSTTAGRAAISTSFTVFVQGCSLSSMRGNAVSAINNGGIFMGCYFHDSVSGITGTTAAFACINCIFENCVTAPILITGSSTNILTFFNNTFYGAENKQGTAISLASGVTGLRIANNIIYGFSTGISHASGVYFGGYGNYNDYFNNTADVSGWPKGMNDLAVNPSFTNMAQLTGSTATTSTTTLTQSGGNFATVTDGVDYIRIVSGTGVTAGLYPIISHTATTVTSSISFGTNATADKVWQITTGHNLAVGTNLKATGFPGVFNGSNTTGYLDIGAAQRQEAGTSGGSFTFGS